LRPPPSGPQTPPDFSCSVSVETFLSPFFFPSVAPRQDVQSPFPTDESRFPLRRLPLGPAFFPFLLLLFPQTFRFQHFLSRSYHFEEYPVPGLLLSSLTVPPSIVCVPTRRRIRESPTSKGVVLNLPLTSFPPGFHTCPLLGKSGLPPPLPYRPRPVRPPLALPSLLPCSNYHY